MAILTFITLRWLDVIDILLVASIISYFYNLVRGTMAMRILIGLILVLIFWRFTQALQMELVADLIGTFIGIGAISFVIIFQPELRKFLTTLGSSQLVFDSSSKGLFKFKSKNNIHTTVVKHILAAVEEMSRTKTGAIIVIDNQSDLTEVINSGTMLNAQVSDSLIHAIFFKNSPLHDGAIVISKDNVVAAGCVLPNSDRKDLPKNFGLRHRAVIGLSESSTAYIILVSEETGKIMFAHTNQYNDNLSVNQLKEKLNQLTAEKE